jgi:hypothetical protein
MYTIRDEVAFDAFEKKEDRVKFTNVYNAFTSRGKLEDKDGNYKKFELRDLVTEEDLMRFIPQTVETVVREAIEPNLFIVDRLFQKITVERGTRVQIGALGALEAGRVGQAGEYPERTLDLDGGDMIAITTDKYGLKISLTEEVLSENQYDVINVWLRAAGKALARVKERTAAKLINEMGYKIFDNVSPTTAYFGSTHGRNIAGLGNGSMTVTDVFEMYAYLLNRGFTPDVLMMHPLAWKTFMTDTEMREVVLNGSTVANVRQPSGNRAPDWGTTHQGYGLRTTGTGRETTSGNSVKGPSAWLQTLNPLGATFNIAPRYLPTPLEVIVTPFIPFVYGAKGTERMDSGCATNVVMVDSQNCGVIGQSEQVRTDRWVDPERDITNIKMREAYGFAILEQGKAIAKASNIAVTRNYNFENANNQVLAELNISGVPTGMTAPVTTLP